MKIIYFDNAATSYPKPESVAEAVFNAVKNGGSARGSHSLAAGALRTLYNAREATAEIFNADDPRRTAFCSGATEALNTAINGLLSPGAHVIVTVAEHNSVLRPLYRLGCRLDFINCDDKGQLVYDGVKKLIKADTKAIVANHVSNVTGNAADIQYLSKLCREHGLYFILDCSQSAGKIPVNASTADVVCFTGHKSLFGVQGTGGLIAGDCDIKPLKVGGSGINSYDMNHPSEMPERLEAGTQNIHGIAGLIAGIEFIKSVSLEKIAKKESELTKRFIDGVSQIKGIKVFGNTTWFPVVSLIKEGYGSSEISEILSEKFNIATRSGAHCAPLMHKALGTEKTGLTRFSFSYFNTVEEIDYCLKALESI